VCVRYVGCACAGSIGARASAPYHMAAYGSSHMRCQRPREQLGVSDELRRLQLEVENKHVTCMISRTGWRRSFKREVHDDGLRMQLRPQARATHSSQKRWWKGDRCLTWPAAARRAHKQGKATRLSKHTSDSSTCESSILQRGAAKRDAAQRERRRLTLAKKDTQQRRRCRGRSETTHHQSDEQSGEPRV